MKKIKGLKRAVGDYQRANSEGYYSPRYGTLMFDYSDYSIWCDEFYSLGHNSWNEYDDSNVVNLGRCLQDGVTMRSVKSFIEKFPTIEEYNKIYRMYYLTD